MLVILFVRHLEVTERHVAHGYVKEAVRHLHLFKAVHGNRTVLVELLRDPPGDAVDLHAVGAACRHVLWQHPDKVPHAAGGL